MMHAFLLEILTALHYRYIEVENGGIYNLVSGSGLRIK